MYGVGDDNSAGEEGNHSERGDSDAEIPNIQPQQTPDPIVMVAVVVVAFEPVSFLIFSIL